MPKANITGGPGPFLGRGPESENISVGLCRGAASSPSSRPAEGRCQPAPPDDSSLRARAETRHTRNCFFFFNVLFTSNQFQTYRRVARAKSREYPHIHQPEAYSSFADGSNNVPHSKIPSLGVACSLVATSPSSPQSGASLSLS